jgi:putative transposase
MDRQNYSQRWQITYHFVWGPMRSKSCLVGEIAERLQELIEEKASGRSFELLAVIILPDRVYLAVAAPPTLAPHHIVCQVKAHTSRVLRDEFPELTRIPTLWTRAYLVMAGDEIPTEEVLKRYEALQQPRRPRGRPRKVGPSSSDEDDDTPPSYER